MRRDRRNVPAAVGAAAALAATLAVAPSVPAAAQSDPDRRGQTWSSIAELPEFGGGVWEIVGGGAFATPAPPLAGEYAAGAEAYAAARVSGEIEDTPAANCVPPGHRPRIRARRLSECRDDSSKQRRP